MQIAFGRVRCKASPAKKEGCCPLLGFYCKRICENLNFSFLRFSVKDLLGSSREFTIFNDFDVGGFINSVTVFVKIG